MSTKKTTPKTGQRANAGEATLSGDLTAFAHHLAEVLRIARESDFIGTRFYNDLFDAWNEFQNDTQTLSEVYEGEPYIKLILQAHVERSAARKGGRE